MVFTLGCLFAGILGDTSKGPKRFRGSGLLEAAEVAVH